MSNEPKNNQRKVTAQFDSITAIWGAIVGLAEIDGVAPLNAEDGCWQRVIDEQWVIWVNAHNEAQKTSDAPYAATVEPFHCYVEFNGWPAGHFSAWDGWFCAGELANQATFREALVRCDEVRQ